MHKKPAAVFSLKISQSQLLKIFCMYAMSWTCCKCDCSVITKVGLDIVSNPNHRWPCTRTTMSTREHDAELNPYITDYSQASIDPSSFLKTSKGRKSFLFNNNLFYNDTKKNSGDVQSAAVRIARVLVASLMALL